MKLLKIGFASSIAILIIGLVLFFIGAGVKNFNIMWAGLIVFCIGVAVLIAFFFIRLAIKERRKKIDEIKRG